jgi:methylated-DNA-protein-cysteine methyltransferase-like protein
MDVAEPRVIRPGFHLRVFAAVALVPRGRLTTYGDVATLLGSPRVARQVGWALAALPGHRGDVPWQRVINARGAISFKGDPIRAVLQASRLADDGVVPGANGLYDLASLRFDWAGVPFPFPDIDGES